MGLRIIAVHIQVQPSAEPRRLEADIKGVGRFPAEFGVAQAALDKAVEDIVAVKLIALAAGSAVLDGRQRSEGRPRSPDLGRLGPLQKDAV